MARHQYSKNSQWAAKSRFFILKTWKPGRQVDLDPTTIPPHSMTGARIHDMTELVTIGNDLWHNRTWHDITWQTNSSLTATSICRKDKKKTPFLFGCRLVISLSLLFYEIIVTLFTNPKKRKKKKTTHEHIKQKTTKEENKQTTLVSVSFELDNGQHRFSYFPSFLIVVLSRCDINGLSPRD